MNAAEIAQRIIAAYEVGKRHASRDATSELQRLREAHIVHVERDGDLPVSCPQCRYDDGRTAS